MGGRSAPPMTNRRSVLWPTNVVTFVAGRARSDGFPIARRSSSSPRRRPGRRRPAPRRSCPRGFRQTAAPAENPHRPTACVVMPCSIALRQPGSLSSDTSECVCRSMNPGAMASPGRSISSAPAPSGTRPADRHDPAVVDRRGRRRSAGPPVPSYSVRVAEDDVDHRSASAPEVTYRSQRPHGAEVSTSVGASPYRQPRSSSRPIVSRATPGILTRAVAAPSSAATADRSRRPRRRGRRDRALRSDRARHRPGRRRSRPTVRRGRP